MAILVSSVVRRLENSLQDIGSVRWPAAEHFDGINDAQNALLEARPDLYEAYTDHLLVAGNEQNAPSDSYIIFDVMWNIESDGSQGRRITSVKRSVLDRHRAAWTSKNENTTVRHWAQDVRERARFVVAPRQPTGTSQKVHMRYSKRPVDVTGTNDNVDAPDERINEIYYFCMMRLLEKDEKFSGSAQSLRFAQMWAAALRAGTSGEDEAEQVEDENKDGN